MSQGWLSCSKELWVKSTLVESLPEFQQTMVKAKERDIGCPLILKATRNVFCDVSVQFGPFICNEVVEVRKIARCPACKDNGFICR